MLDNETKSRIDSARDILVGKVPDPKSQVEQITIALIYKFMDDMDRQSEELGGKASFFTGEYRKHRWANLLDKRLGGHERLLLYAEGIEKMNENKNIPQLFRDIFKGVFLPYRDPETLNLFLKEIDGFAYDHSERLGDAYEYLLNVLGTQGDAGQFRTPRHIIDFIVIVVDPQKHETVLDPACGTAGFPISAYKHILKHNENLTPDDRARLMTNFRGYDIAPDMVRLSRVNMYLHGFPNPVIHEYDALTSEERWDERCDVIMANPPFMTPKGGIRPHNRFSIKAKRSEVLFVDYIAEHLNSGGRAGIIVPEGIIFQSQNAYKNLRRMLVEDYLWAVVSLPAGVFNPYSGVKTSILFLDRKLAKRTDDILFVKIENDGFDLGAQRRPIADSDLPEALIIIQRYKQGGKDTAANPMALRVPRKRLLDSNDVNLTGDRYRQAATIHATWPIVTLGEICELVGGGTPSKAEKRFWKNGTIKWLSAKHINDQGKVIGYELITKEAVNESATSIVPANATVFVTRVSVGKCTLLWEPFAINQDLTGVIVRDSAKVLPGYVYVILRSLAPRVEADAQGLGVKGVTRQYIAGVSIPVPLLDVQREVVAELERYQKIVDGARQILANYQPALRLDPAWPRVKMGELCGITAPMVDPSNSKYSSLPHVSAENMESGTGRLLAVRTAAEDRVTSSNYLFEAGSVLYSKIRPYLCKAAHVDFRGVCSADMYPLDTNQKKILPEFLLRLLLTEEFTRYADNCSRRARMPKLNREQLFAYETVLPPLKIQREIVAELQAERSSVEVNRKLIETFERKTQAKLAEIWGAAENRASDQ